MILVSIASPSRDVYSTDCVRHRETLENWHRMRDTVARVQNNSCCPTGRISMQLTSESHLGGSGTPYSQRQYSLNGNIQSRNIEGVEEYLRGNVAVMARI